MVFGIGTSSIPLACLCSRHKVSAYPLCAYICVCLRCISSACIGYGHRFRSLRSSGVSFCYSGHCELDGELMTVPIRFSLCPRPLDSSAAHTQRMYVRDSQISRFSGFLFLRFVFRLPFFPSFTLWVRACFPMCLINFMSAIWPSCYFSPISRFIRFLLSPTQGFSPVRYAIPTIILPPAFFSCVK